MKIITSELQFQTQGETDVINITDEVAEKLKGSGLKEGIVIVFVIGSTAGVTTCEYEPALVSDIKTIFEKLIPRNVTYRHDATWGDANGFSHLRASLLGPTLIVPFKQSGLLLGTWQQIVLVDFDNTPRRRKIVVQIQGE